jgi:hypothetical protein
MSGPAADGFLMDIGIVPPAPTGKLGSTHTDNNPRTMFMKFQGGNTMTTTASTHSLDAKSPQWFAESDCKLEDFIALVSQETRVEDYAYADAVEQNVLIYGNRLRSYGRLKNGPMCRPSSSAR